MVGTGSDRPLIITSGIGLLTPGQLTAKESIPSTNSNPRVEPEEALTALNSDGGSWNSRASLFRIRRAFDSRMAQTIDLTLSEAAMSIRYPKAFSSSCPNFKVYLYLPNSF